MGKKNELIDRTGEVSYNKYGSKMTIVKYINASNIIVGFENGYTVKSNYCSFAKRKNIKSPYDITVGGIGYLGEGNYVPSKNGIHTKEYDIWRNIIERCYNQNKYCKSISYKGCKICEEWLCFQNFAQWYIDNFYQVNNEKMCVDKDILVKGNQIYSPNTCMIVPERINILFVKGDIVKKYPIGVSIANNRLRARCKIVDKQGVYKEIHIGYFDTQIEAFQAYKTFKERYIKQVADEYKDKIPEKLYNAMYDYKVEIND